MDGALLQSRIYAGYRKSALRAGQPYAHFRAASGIDPTAPGNQLGTVACLFAANSSFSAAVKYKIPTRYLYADGAVLQQLDILIGPYGTFYVGDLQPDLPIHAVRCNDTVKIERQAYVGTNLVPQLIVSAVPAFRQLKKVDQKPQFGAATAATPIGEFFLFLPVADGLVRQGDIITDQYGRLYTLDTIDDTEIGNVVTMRQDDTPA